MKETQPPCRPSGRSAWAEEISQWAHCSVLTNMRRHLNEGYGTLRAVPRRDVIRASVERYSFK
jgi:hypothetical protein